MQALVIYASRTFRHGDRVEDAVWTNVRIDYWSGSDTDLRRDLTAIAGVGRSLAVPEQGDVPILGSGIGVKGVGASVLGHDKKSIMYASSDGERGNVERLRVHFPIDIYSEQFSEIGSLYVVRPERRFVEVLSGPITIVMPGKDLGRHWDRHSERQEGRHQQTNLAIHGIS